MIVSRPNNVMNHGSPAAGMTYGSPLTSPMTRSAARSTIDLLMTLVRSALSDSISGHSASHCASGPSEGPLAQWLAECPEIESDSALLTSVINKSIVDLAALRVMGEVNGEPYVMPAAGLPWFMTLF